MFSNIYRCYGSHEVLFGILVWNVYNYNIISL